MKKHKVVNHDLNEIVYQEHNFTTRVLARQRLEILQKIHHEREKILLNYSRGLLSFEQMSELLQVTPWTP